MVHSKKHYVQNSLETIAGSAVETKSIVVAVEAKDAILANFITEGSTVKAVYFEQWMRAGDTVGASYIAVIYKLPGAAVVFTAAQLADLHGSENKKNILWTSQGLLNDQDADAMSVIRGWIKIPKSKQRFGLGDQLVFQIFAQGAIDIHLCGFALFKEYS